MSFSVNTTPLLGESNSDESDSENDGAVTFRGGYSAPSGSQTFKPPEPRDKYYVTYIIFYLMGMVTLLPWTFFITADDYWLYKFRDINANVSNTSIHASHTVPKRTPLQASFTSYVSVASAVPGLIALLLNSFISNSVSLHFRVFGSLILMLVFFIETLVFVVVDTDKWQYGFFTLTLVSIICLNVFSAILSGSIFGVMGRFRPIYITATLSGQALGGIFAALAEIASLALGVSSVHSAFVYFTIGIVTIAVAIALYAVLVRSYFFQFHLYEKHTLHNDAIDNENPIRPRLINQKMILRQILTYGVAMFAVFAITVSVYPSVTVLIESKGKGQGHKWNDVFFVPTIAYLLFSIGDYMGRILAGRFVKPRKDYIIFILTMARFIFIPLMMLCNAQPRHNWAVVFNEDYQYILILFLCALSNGYLANLIAICAPRIVEAHEKEVASTMITVFMGFGLALGSVVSLFLVNAL